MSGDLPKDGLDTVEGFGRFYEEHARVLLRYFYRRTADAEVAADLCAETFAAALASRSR